MAKGRISGFQDFRILGFWPRRGFQDFRISGFQEPGRRQFQNDSRLSLPGLPSFLFFPSTRLLFRSFFLPSGGDSSLVYSVMSPLFVPLSFSFFLASPPGRGTFQFWFIATSPSSFLCLPFFPFAFLLSFRSWSKPLGKLSRPWDVCVGYWMFF